MSSTLRVQHVPRHRRRGAPASRSRLMKASALMAAGSLVSRALGFVRNFLFGAILAGSSSGAASAFSAANTLPNTVWLLVGGGTLNAILVPAIVRAVKRPDRGSDYISRLMTLVATASLGLTAICMVAVPVLLILTSGALPPSTYALAMQLGYWMMPQIFFSALYVMCGQLLNAHDSFGPYQWAPVLNNLVAIVGAALFLGVWGTVGDPTQWTLDMVVGMAAVNVGGSAAQVLFLFWFIKGLDLRLRPKWGLRGLGLGKLSRIGLWSLGMLLLAQIGIWATRWSTGGAVQANEQSGAQNPALLSLDWAYLAFMIPQGVIAVSIVTATFPTISRRAADHDHTGVLTGFTRTNRLLAVPMVLSTAVFIALSGPIMWVIGGGTSPEVARANGGVLVGYMLGLVPFAALYLIKRVFYAYEDARTPFMVQIPIMLVGLIAAPLILFLAPPEHATMIASITSSVGNVAGWVMGLWLLRRLTASRGARTPGVAEGGLVWAKLLLAAGISWAVGTGLVQLLGSLIWISRATAVGMGVVIAIMMCSVFGALAYALRVEEVRWGLGAVTRRVLRRTARAGSTS